MESSYWLTIYGQFSLVNNILKNLVGQQNMKSSHWLPIYSEKPHYSTIYEVVLIGHQHMEKSHWSTSIYGEFSLVNNIWRFLNSK